jgi:ABC-type Fe3+/spermidine/putrescine transport system ATPase subunit
VIELKNIELAVEGFSLKVDHTFEAKKMHVVLGPSGSGKTVLLEIIAGLLKPDAGQVILDKNNVSKFLPEDRLMGYLPQDNTLFPHLNVLDNILFGLRVQKREVDDEAIMKICDRLKVSHILARSTDKLSGGEIQRIALARSIVTGNNVLLLDEPTSSLNQSLKMDICHLLLEIQEEFGLTVIMVTHDMESAFMLGQSLVFLINGVVEQTCENVLDGIQPSNLVVAEFMGFRNVFHGRVYHRPNGVYIECIELKTEILVRHESGLNFSQGESVCFGLSPKDVRVILIGHEIDYLEASNRLVCNVLQTFNKGATLSIQMKTQNSNVIIESDFPITKRAKIKIEKGAEIEVILHSRQILVWPMV